VLQINVENLRMQKLPHIWCPGCGNGIALSALTRAIDKLGYDHDEVAIVSGIGCSSRSPGYLNFNTLHTTHGRAIAFATGLKIFKPKMKVFIVTGDGDCTAIGGNHFIVPFSSFSLPSYTLVKEDLDFEMLLGKLFLDQTLMRRIEERDGTIIYTDGEKGLSV
jgi:hypothetical protein